MLTITTPDINYQKFVDVHFPEELKEKAKYIQTNIIENKYFNAHNIKVVITIYVTIVSDKKESYITGINYVHISNRELESSVVLLKDKSLISISRNVPETHSKFLFSLYLTLKDFKTILFDETDSTKAIKLTRMSSQYFNTCLLVRPFVDLQQFKNEFSRILSCVILNYNSELEEKFKIFNTTYTTFNGKRKVYESIKYNSDYSIETNMLLYLYIYNLSEDPLVFHDVFGFYIDYKDHYVTLTTHMAHFKKLSKITNQPISISDNISSITAINKKELLEFINVHAAGNKLSILRKDDNPNSLRFPILPSFYLDNKAKELPYTEYPKDMLQQAILYKLMNPENDNADSPKNNFSIDLDILKKFILFSKSENILFILLGKSLMVYSEENPDYILICR